MEDSHDLPVHQGSMSPDVGASFEASLATHLIFFRWCEQNWRWFVRDIEQRIRSSLVRAKTVPIESEPCFTGPPPKTETGMSASSKGSDFKTATFAALQQEKRNIMQSIKGLRQPRGTTFDLAPAQTGAHDSGARRVPEGLLVLNMFNYKDLQRLSIIAGRLEEASLVVQLNIDALRDAYEYYERPIVCEGLREDVRTQMEKSTVAFLRRLRQIIRSLETTQTQLGSLRRRLDSGKSLVRTHCTGGHPEH